MSENKNNSLDTNKVITIGSMGVAIVALGAVAVVLSRDRVNVSYPVPSNSSSTTIADNSTAAPIPIDPSAYNLTPDEDGWIHIDRSLVARTDEGAAAQMFSPPADFDRGIATADYHLAGTVSYAERWYQAFEAYLPEFGSEIDDLPGAEKIHNYYQLTKLPAVQKEMEDYLDSFAGDDKVWDSEMDENHYEYRTYTAGRYGDRVSVIYYDESYAGGAHPGHVYTADNFLADGAMVQLRDLFASEADYQRLVGGAIVQWQKENDVESEIFGTGPYTGSLSDEVQFAFAADGVQFIFNEYDIGPYAAGPAFLTVPYGELVVK